MKNRAEAITRGSPLAGRLAAPSFVMPGTVAGNVRFLAGRVDEVALCLFEALPCLSYGEADLPADLAKLPLNFHVHLPADLPWPARMNKHASGTLAGALELALAVFSRVAFLSPMAAVLHPPVGSPAHIRRALAAFAEGWRRRTAVPLLIENTGACDLFGLGDSFLSDHGCAPCLDVGHLMGYGQWRILNSALPEQAPLAHWSAPGTEDQHLPLTLWSPGQRALAKELFNRMPAATRHLLEVFHWKGVAASIPVLEALAGHGERKG